MTRWKNLESGRGAQLKVLQRMPRIHSWQEVIAPRDCWCILHRTTLRPAAGSATSTSSSLEPPSSPTRFPSPLAPPWRNEQRAISLLLNACHKSPRAPSRSPSPCAHPPPATLSRFSPLFHLFSPEGSTLTRTTSHLVSCFLWLNFSALCFIAFILRIFFVSFLSYPGFLPSHWRLKKRKRKWRTHRVPILHFLRLKKNNDKMVLSPRRTLLCFYTPFLFFPSSRSLFLHDFLLYRVLIRLRK